MNHGVLKRLCALLFIISALYLLFFSGLGSPFSAILIWIYSTGAIGGGLGLLFGARAFRWAWVTTLIATIMVALFAAFNM